jgi:hypothetical protein
MLGIEVQAAAHFEAILHEWCDHCFEQLSCTEAGMLAVHLQQVAGLSYRLAREAEEVCGGRFMLPCPMYEGRLASPEDLCKQLRLELRRVVLSKDKSAKLSIPEGGHEFQMIPVDYGQADEQTLRNDRRECFRLQQALKTADNRIAELVENERMLKEELRSINKSHAEELQDQLDQLCQAGDTLCPACDQRFSMDHLGEEAQVNDAILVHPAVPDEALVPPKDHSIVAAVRLKPHPPQGVPIWTLPDGTSGSVIDGRTGQDYGFDQVFGPEASTENVFASCGEEMVQSFCQGINATIMAYGQTASGKTFTMEGACGHDGIIQLSVNAIFSYLGDQSEAGTCYTMRASYLEIHNEKVFDLLADTGPVEVRLLHSPTGIPQTVPPLKRWGINDADDVLRCLEAGARYRHVGATRMNEHSSRSHTVLQIQLESRQSNDAFMRRSVLNLVDLAGSESAKATGAVGERFTEGRNINRSLLALSQVVSNLADNSRATPRHSFRDSKLTRIIQQSLGGNSRTALICTVSTQEWNYYECRRTLEFALRAKSIKNTVSTNLVKLSSGRPRSAKESQELRQLHNQNERLRMQLEQVRAQLGIQDAQENCMLRPGTPKVHSQKRQLAPRQMLADVTNLPDRSNSRSNSMEKRRQIQQR